MDGPAGRSTLQCHSRRLHEAVEKAQAIYHDGDVIQVVLSQRLSCKLSPALCEQPFNLYRALRYLNPSPYMYYLSYGEVKIIGLFARTAGQRKDVSSSPALSPAHASAGARRRRMRRWRRNCSRIPKSARSISCWSTWAATIWAAFAISAASRWTR